MLVEIIRSEYRNEEKVEYEVLVIVWRDRCQTLVAFRV